MREFDGTPWLKAAVGTVVGGLLAATLVGPATAAEVTYSRLVNAGNEPQNWLTVYQQYNNYRHSNLNQINQSTIKDLKYAFSVSLGGLQKGESGSPRQESTPLVNDGFMYVSNAWGEVLKIDVRSGRRGRILWKYDPAVDPAYPPLITDRGVALWGNNVYVDTLDARLIAIDVDSGEVVWETNTQAGEGPQNQAHTGAPLAVKDMILVGQSNGFRGNRGWVGAFKAETGEKVWKTFTVPGPGEPGHETWEDDHNAWATGGAAVWTTGAYDPVSELAYYGTGDPAPWFDPEFRPGDNLYSTSTIALNVNSGAIEWYFQETPGESWDFDSVNPRLLFDVEIDGMMRKVSSNFSRNGFYYTLDRITGEFILAKQYVDEVNWTAGIDPKTGKPLEYERGAKLQNYAGIATRRPSTDYVHCPNYSGGVTYFPPTYDPKRMLAYVAGSVGCGVITITEPLAFDKDWRGENLCCKTTKSDGRQTGHITAVNVRTGEVAAKVNLPFPNYAGLLSTAGDLVFAGQLDGKFAAYDSDTLAEVWSINIGTGIWAPPITYSIEGKQYIAVVAGGGDTQGPRKNIPELNTIERDSILFVFSL